VWYRPRLGETRDDREILAGKVVHTIIAGLGTRG